MKDQRALPGCDFDATNLGAEPVAETSAIQRARQERLEQNPVDLYEFELPAAEAKIDGDDSHERSAFDDSIAALFMGATVARLSTKKLSIEARTMIRAAAAATATEMKRLVSAVPDASTSAAAARGAPIARANSSRPPRNVRAARNVASRRYQYLLTRDSARAAGIQSLFLATTLRAWSNYLLHRSALSGGWVDPRHQSIVEFVHRVAMRWDSMVTEANMPSESLVKLLAQRHPGLSFTHSVGDAELRVAWEGDAFLAAFLGSLLHSKERTQLVRFPRSIRAKVLSRLLSHLSRLEVEKEIERMSLHTTCLGRHYQA